MRNDMRPSFCLARQRNRRPQWRYFCALMDAQSGKPLRSAGKEDARNTASGAWNVNKNPISEMEEKSMAFFNSAVTVLQTLVVALGAGLGIWGAINLLEGYGNDNPGANAHV